MATFKQKRKEAVPVAIRDEGPGIESVTWEGLTWTNIENPTQKEIKYLAENYPFHPLDLDDCVSRKQRPKLDVYQDYLFFIFHFSVYNKETRISTHDQVSTFLSDNYLITIHSGLLKPLSKLFRSCQTDEQAKRDNLSNGSGYLLYRILDRTIDAYFPIMDKILGLMEDIEDAVFDENIQSAQELALLRRDIITQRRITFPLRTATVSLEVKIQKYCKIDMSVYFGDLLDHMNKICETLDDCKEAIEIFKDADFVLGTERLNRIMRILTVVATIVLPFMAISSVWGMNVYMPGSIDSGSWMSFFLIIGAMVVIAGAMLYFFYRKKWI